MFPHTRRILTKRLAILLGAAPLFAAWPVRGMAQDISPAAMTDADLNRVRADLIDVAKAIAATPIRR